MINLRLIPSDFTPVDFNHNVIKITKINLESRIKLIESSIECFNDEIQWDGMYNIEEAIKRIENSDILYIGMNDLGVIGHTWFNSHLDGRKVFNLFVRNKIHKKDYSGKEFLSCVISRFENNKTIYCEVDEWNTKSLQLLQRLGFRVQ